VLFDGLVGEGVRALFDGSTGVVVGVLSDGVEDSNAEMLSHESVGEDRKLVARVFGSTPANDTGTAEGTGVGDGVVGWAIVLETA